jgi:hypothetical protein
VAEDTQHAGASGIRITARLTTSSEAGASYDVALLCEEGDFTVTATLDSPDGVVTLGSWERVEPPSALVQPVRALLRSAWQRRRSGHAWPRRLARWRPRNEADAG